MEKILIANRGEIAIRIARAAAELGIQTVAVYSQDDASSLHICSADQAWPLKGKGAAAYLDMEQMIAAAKDSGCDAIHPGYGFLSENSTFARYCVEERLNFIGPRPEVLDLFGNKGAARSFAKRCGVPLLPGTVGATSLEEARDFFVSLGPGAAVMIKAVMGGGGRGMRAVYDLADLDQAFSRCQSEAYTAFGVDEVYVEQLLFKPRHIEVQVIGDGREAVHLGERDCTMQRRSQKLIEIAPCPILSPAMRARITDAAICMAQAADLDSLATFEFLVEKIDEDEPFFAFMEANPRLQVEHTVTEEVMGVDLVKAQIELAGGKSLSDLDMRENAAQPRFFAVELRVNAETLDSSGGAQATDGTISVYDVPTGPGVRVDGYGYSGYTINPAFDSLLAKLIVTSRSPRFEDVLAKAHRTLSEFRIEGVTTNIPLLLDLLSRREVADFELHTRFIEENTASLRATVNQHRKDFFAANSEPNTQTTAEEGSAAPDGTVAIKSPMLGRIIALSVTAGDPVALGQTVAVVEALKMEHEIKADQSGYVHTICAGIDDVVSFGAPLLFLEPAEITLVSNTSDEEVNLDAIRPDLAEVIARHAFGLDASRPEAVDGRHNKGQRTARENVEDLCDPESFIEYGALTIAAQRKRRSLDDLIRKTPGDGLIGGFGSINGGLFGEEKSRCLIMSYDFTVLAGTQGFMNHKKMDRLLKVAHQYPLPTVLIAEGGGGRPGDVDANTVAGLDLSTFASFAGLSGKAPLIGITSGFCFAGNAALLGCCDVIIATKNSNIGMGGPAMIEGGGLGVVKPQDIGPIEVQEKNGVVDITVADEAEAVAVAKQYLSYFQGAVSDRKAEDQRLLRRLIPENRLRVYDIRAIIRVLADTGTVLELRPKFGLGMITALIRIEGRPFGVIANNPKHVSGAIEAADADKAARFLQLCNSHSLPVLSLVDTPGFMVGPEIETTAQVRHVCRMFMTGSHLSIPFFTVVLRKGYGLGAMAMSAGSFHDTFFTASWPSGEFGGMGLEGAVKHAYRKELAAIEDPVQREVAYQQYVDESYKKGKAINMASYLEIDSVIDPADTRRWISNGLKSINYSNREKKSIRYVDTW